jgi:serine/threonine-protein kinase HipA
MTLLGYTDGTDASSGVSYVELVDFITKYGARPENDLKQLWRRIVFSICVSNTDDHLRNHGFLLTEKGWVLSPAYDINPVETGMGLKLNISEDDNALDVNLALEVAPYFRIEKREGLIIINKIQKIVSEWKIVANKYGISRLEQENKNTAFTF